MSATIDPYDKWLGIAPKHQPPDHYRLLGLELFEADPKVISAAAERQISNVRQYQIGQYEDQCQKLLNELAAAKVCLIDPGKKAAYDAQLRKQLAPDADGPGPPSQQVATPPRSSTDPTKARKNASRIGTQAYDTQPTAFDELAAISTKLPPKQFTPKHEDRESRWATGKGSAIVGGLVAAPHYVIQRIDRGLAFAAGKENFVLHNIFRVLLVSCVAVACVMAIGMTTSLLESRRAEHEPREVAGGERQESLTAFTEAKRAWSAALSGADVQLFRLYATQHFATAQEKAAFANSEAKAGNLQQASDLYLDAVTALERARAETLHRVKADWSTAYSQADTESLHQFAAQRFATAQKKAALANREEATGSVRQATILYWEAADTLKRAAAETRTALQAPRERAKEITVDLGEGVSLPMLLVPAGSFLMGDASGESDARPVHKVTITKAFFLGKYEVTQEQWAAVMGNRPSRFKGGANPVETVNWSGCQEFLVKLNAIDERAGWRYTLPTEAQWEYACRAGSQSQYSFGDDEGSLGDYAWFRGNSGFETHPVGQKNPNDWGFYDMHGNVREWCADWYDDKYYGNSPAADPCGPASATYRVFRGGSWGNDAEYCRSAYRYWYGPGGRYGNLGFRVAAVPSSEPGRPVDRAAAAEYQVSVDPPSAEVRVTGRGARISGSGASRKITVDDADGKTTVRIVAALSGYESYEQELQPQAGQSGRLEVRLKPLPDLAKEITVDLGQGISLPMLLVPAGSFLMGDASGESDEKPVHKVTITKAFYLGKYEVTQEQWAAVMGDRPSEFNVVGHPVETVSWNGCQEFLVKLNALHGRTGWRYNLPTEAQWEYACRAGSQSQYSFGDDEASLRDYAWFRGNSGFETHPVGQKKPNDWGFYDMHGNVREWCADWYDDKYYGNSPAADACGPASATSRVFRGGSWAAGAVSCRSAYRYAFGPVYRYSGLGFRLAAVPSQQAEDK